MKFYDSNQAKTYLARSIVRKDEKPVYVTNVGMKLNRLTMWYTDIGGMDREKSIGLYSNNVNLKPIPTGMVNNYHTMYGKNGDHAVNVLKSAVFMCRMPVRAWKVGLTVNNIRMYCYGRAATANNVLFNSGMNEMVANKYPSYEDTLRHVRARRDYELENSFIGISRRFAIVTDSFDLHYKDIREPVGKIGREVTLFKKYEYLNEVMMEDLHAYYR